MSTAGAGLLGACGADDVPPTDAVVADGGSSSGGSGADSGTISDGGASAEASADAQLDAPPDAGGEGEAGSTIACMNISRSNSAFWLQCNSFPHEPSATGALVVGDYYLYLGWRSCFDSWVNGSGKLLKDANGNHFFRYHLEGGTKVASNTIALTETRDGMWLLVPGADQAIVRKEVCRAADVGLEETGTYHSGVDVVPPTTTTLSFTFGDPDAGPNAHQEIWVLAQ